MKLKRRTKVHYGQRFAVSAYIPTREQVEAANERTEGLVGYFLSCARRDDSSQWQDDLYTLARSCYLQGVRDMAMVAADLRVRETRAKEPSSYSNDDDDDEH